MSIAPAVVGASGREKDGYAGRDTAPHRQNHKNRQQSQHYFLHRLALPQLPQ